MTSEMPLKYLQDDWHSNITETKDLLNQSLRLIESGIYITLIYS